MCCFISHFLSQQSVSAFAPICNPIQCQWGKKALGGYLGSDASKWEVGVGTNRSLKCINEWSVNAAGGWQHNSGVLLSWYCSFTALLSMNKHCTCLAGLSCYLLPDGDYNKCNEIEGSHQIDLILPCFMKILRCGLRRSMGSLRLSVMHGSSENFKRFKRKKVLLKYLQYF